MPAVLDHELPCVKFAPKKDERANTAYQSRQLTEESERIKQPQRERVMSHIVENHRRGRMKMFSLPGVTWEFERQLSEAWAHPVRFVCVDWSYGTIERGASRIVGGKPLRSEWQLNSGKVYGYGNEDATVMWSEASSFFHINRTDFKSKAKYKRWHYGFKRLTAAWFDFTSPLCRETILSLARSGASMSQFNRTVPVAVTVLLAREPDERILSGCVGSALDKRVQAIETAFNLSYFRRFELSDAWQYESVGGVPMGVVCGIMHLKEHGQTESIPTRR